MEKPSEVRERILKYATLLFHKQGYQATGINQVIAEANVAKASLYQHFASKEALCLAYLNRRHTCWMQALREYLGQDASEDKVILRAFDFITHMNQQEDYRGCAFINISSETPSLSNGAILEVIQNHKNDLRHLLNQLASQDPAGFTVPETGDQLYTLYEGALIASKIFRSDWPVQQAKQVVRYLQLSTLK